MATRLSPPWGEVCWSPVAEELFENGLCLPSGTAMREADIERVVEVIQATDKHGKAQKKPV